MDWNVEQLEIAIKQMDEIQARFYMDGIGNQVADILNEAGLYVTITDFGSRKIIRTEQSFLTMFTESIKRV